MNVPAAATAPRPDHPYGRPHGRHDVNLRLPRQAQSVTVARHALDAILATLSISEDNRERLAIGVTEACANAVQHAYGTDQYQLSAQVDERRCVVSVADHGCGFQPIPGHLIPRAVTAKSGRGLPLIAALADQFELYTSPGDGTEVRLVVDLAPDDGE